MMENEKYLERGHYGSITGTQAAKPLTSNVGYTSLPLPTPNLGLHFFRRGWVDPIVDC
jgi:hypothetical protein